MADPAGPDQTEGDISPPLVSLTPSKDKDDVRNRRTSRDQSSEASGKQPPPQRKKSSMVVTGDSLQQLQLKLRANRDERRLTLDARHQFLFAQLADALGIDQSVVEDQVLGDERFNLIDNFFVSQGSRKLMFFYQEGKKTWSSRLKLAELDNSLKKLAVKETGSTSTRKLFITPGSLEGATGLCLFFLRTHPDKPVTSANIASDVVFMWMDCSGGKVLEAFEAMMNKVLIPVAKSQQWGDDTNEEGNAKMSEFLDQLTKFADDLTNARKSMTGYMTLSDADCCTALDQLHSFADYQAASNNTEFVRKVEELIAMWSRQIEQVITESEQIRREADDVGPGAELQYWIHRRNKFDALFEQVKSQRCKAAVGILNTLKSKSLRKWRQLDACITDSANEAKDNVKFLRTLDSYFGTLEKSNPVVMVDLVPSLINTTRMIYSISTYYNTPERMTSLFVKITNQLIKTCKDYINEGVVKVCWEHSYGKLISRIDECIALNTAYQQQFHKTKERLKSKPEERQFEFSENYIFGKFDTFTKRLEKIADMARMMSAYSRLVDIRVDGIDTIVVRYKKLVENAKKKNYDVLDHRKQEFDFDYTEFCNQFDSLNIDIQRFIDSWFNKNITTEQALDLLNKFEIVEGCRADLVERYKNAQGMYSQELEQVRQVYQSEKTDPSAPRNLPPIAGRIAWARQLFRRIEGPMKVLKMRLDITKTEDGRKIVRNYNKLAAVLLEYEVLYHRGWCQAIEMAMSGMNASLLILHPSDPSQYIVNIDPQIIELIQEAKYLQKMNLEVIGSALVLMSNEERIRKTREILSTVLLDYNRVISEIPWCLTSVLRPYRQRVETVIRPGLESLSWKSTNVDQYLDSVCRAVSDLERLSNIAKDIVESRVESVLETIASTQLCTLPDDAVRVDEFLKMTENHCLEAARQLSRSSSNVESSIKELIDAVKSPLTEIELHNLMNSDPTHKEPDAYTALLNNFAQKSVEAFIRCTRLSLEAMRRRLLSTSRFSGMMRTDADSESNQMRPLLAVDIVLAIPKITLRPNLEETQSFVNRAVQTMIKAVESVTQWTHVSLLQRKLVALESEATNEDSSSEEVKTLLGLPFIKPLSKLIMENNDISKLVSQLSSIIAANRHDVADLLDSFTGFEELWKSDPKSAAAEFVEKKQPVTEYDATLRYYRMLDDQIVELTPSQQVGPLILLTKTLKAGLLAETQSWKQAFGRALNQTCAAEMDSLFALFDSMQKRLSRPVKDLDDIRSQMAAMTEIREDEIRIDWTIMPIEEAYALLARHGLVFDDGNAERVDSLGYGWRLLRQKVLEVQNHLLMIQPQFKSNLLSGVAAFRINLAKFVEDYTDNGPMVGGISPREASDRLNFYQLHFDDLWRKYQTYSGGEELFGLEVADYPELQRIRKELNLLQKLYQLYNDVLERVRNYYDITWSDINIDKINGELLEFQAKCRKLPKALKEWQAYEDLRKTIDDFNETCPLLELMANKAMQSRHWDRIAKITGHVFDIESDSFLLRNLMEAPLLKYKEDIEDVCISASKEKDIEAKLKTVISDWDAQVFYFSNFKTKGELLLKGTTTLDTVALMEDSLMVLGSLLSNRYNAPFRSTIQEWVSKLTTTSEIIENWLIVQNLWIYLEAVFVGGDIAKQLPQEAKRFANIDKSWTQKIMQRAHEIPNVVQCCVGDDTLGQLLPHLLEQLEMCQKSLTGYLEKKRLLFPRFFFVSDPALLEILGQASDSHTIQAHLLSVFDNTKSVTFDEKVYDKILSITSQEGETVQLKSPVMASGNVENWLADLLNMSRASVHDIIRSATISIADPSFKLLDFENSYAAQVGLLGIQLIWTAQSEVALKSARIDKNIMASTNQKFLVMLNELIDVTTKDLTRYERTKFETLVTIHVHQKDIFDDLVRLHIKSPGDFEWLKQSRFYFSEEEDRCIVSITSIDFTYMNEFLGCTERLVITPLTDRCYITLAQALGMSLGGAPAGPAGTGKTESVKDMGRCLGKYVVVFNCSDQMDYRGLGRIFKGLAQSGSWGCFDEFNRIELPVLSVAAQQIAIILVCKKERKSQFIFSDGDLVDLDSEFGLFLTMNPGYAGRQELPENLKVNFRTVAMMVPDRAIIIRVKLASCGFQQNIILAKKFYTLYKLCEEQLSKQVHYDFGLRNILSVLRTLGATKRSNPDDSEPTTVMRVLRDMNLSKLVDEDEPLFMSLIEDLFPGMKLDKGTYPDIEAAIVNQVNEFGLIHHGPWVLKLIQLFETQRVRHGMMVLGPSGAGKTQCIRVLMNAMTDCGEPHREMRMNPKAITAPQMFGRLDVATNDWTDGIFSTLWRRTHKTKKGEHIWLILDGPVDAIWIENLNSVLDDNKTLTLANGDRIPMAPNCKIIFEVHNIDNASPATVSRNGMVFMSSSVLDWNPILKGWLLRKQQYKTEVIFNTFDSIWSDLYRFVMQNLNPKMDVLECMYIRQALDVMEGLMSMSEDNKEISAQHLQKLIVFSIMWSLGAVLELEDRKKMEDFLKSHSSRLPLPPTSSDDTIYEYVVDSAGQWQHWKQKVPEYNYPRDSVPDYLSILVPNVDNVRTEFLIDILARQSKAVLLIGEQGSAKTVIIQGYCSKYDPDVHLFKSFNFSSASTPLVFQRTIESYVDKRMGTTYGPPAGKKMTVFVDDINMPIINEWGDQVTNEITRQLIEARGFYNLEKPGEFTNIVDIQMMGAMIHPGGGRNDIPQRLKRHFNIFNCTLPSNASIDKVFRTIGCGYFIEERRFSMEVVQLVSTLVSTTRKLWQRTKIKMLPTPAKFHYVFNLRDLSRIWQGMLNATADVVNSVEVLMSLWKHESCRVIADRFTTQDDRNWFEKTLKQVAEEDCGAVIASSMNPEPYFVNFFRDAPEATGEEGEDADLDVPRVYDPVVDMQQLSDRLEMFQQQYNESVRGAKMDLVFFKDAMTNLVKISRIIATPKGHALLVGVGGSGKQSLTRLASFIAGYKTFQITLTRSYNVSNLVEDLKLLYRTTGCEGKGLTFIFTDNEIKDEGFLEYMNNVLSSGEVSNLFARDEMDEMLQELVAPMKKEFPRRPPTNENLYAYYMTRVKYNLHVALCFSPVGEKFRSRSLKFPGLISGCTMNWFQRWPKDALVAVSNHFLAKYEIVCTPAVKQAVVQTMGEFQDMVAETCVDYFQRYRRQAHVTPKSYLSFIYGYKSIYDAKKSEIGQLADRMDTGLMKLTEATEAVNELSQQLAIKEKDLAIASKKADEVLVAVTASAKAAEIVKTQVQKVKDRAQKIVDDIAVDRQFAEEKLEAARPALEAAEAALQTIKPSDIATVRRLTNPPHLIMRIMDCVLLLFQRHLEPVVVDPERPCVKPSWNDGLQLMGGTFLAGLRSFPKDTINEETVELLQPYLQMNDYNYDSAKKSCGDVAGLCSWTQAMAYFFGINKEVLPLKANMAIQESRYEAAMKDLNKAQAELDEKQRELDAVQAVYEQAMREKQVLVDDANTCRRKMNNASALIEGLSGERVRWTDASKDFKATIGRLVGDVLLATGFLSYAGPFNQVFRTQILQTWEREMNRRSIPFTNDLNIISMLVDNATISEWSLQGLPNDELSKQNGLIVTKATRYPLLIDPQGQGKAWIKNREANSELQITNLNHKYFRTHFEDALSLGRPLLIEDVGEELDPALDNVLEKNFIKLGSTLKVKVGDKEVDVMKNFRLYITTKLANPAYTPEVSAKTAIIDFTVTMKGLEDQLLGLVILTEKKELEAERTKLLEEVTANKRKTKELEDSLLYRLSSTQGSLVDDESLIEVLRVTKVTARDVAEKLSTAAETELRINSAREEFRPVATRGSVLYFLIVEMSVVNTMYQTSLKQFLQVFDISMAKSNKSPVTAKRIQNIIEYLTLSTYSYTVRGLYEKDKFLFTILMTLKIQLQAKVIRSEEFQCFIKGGAALDLNAVEPKPKRWISDMTWLNLVELNKLGQFTQILAQVTNNDKAWKDWFDSDAPEEAQIPDGYNSSLDTFHRLLLIRSWCPDRTIPMAKIYVSETMGKQYAAGVVLDMEAMWSESEPRTPMICFLSMGSDPTENIERLARNKSIRYSAVSMGQGQEVHARRNITQSMSEGGWVLLQNCHLGLDYMDELLETISSTVEVNPTFRCWITTEVHPRFSINLLQASIKFTAEPPQGVKAGLKRTYGIVTQDQLDVSNMPQWKPLLYGVAFLHTTVQERRKFGPIGWNIPYEFNQSDFTATVQFIQNHLDDLDARKSLSWTTVRYMIGEVQYGGRVTDDYDKRLLNTFARVWFGDNLFQDNFQFYSGYPMPKSCKTVDDYRSFIEALPMIDSPATFGLHPNADITYQTNMSNEMLEMIVSIQPKDSSGSGGETRETTVYKLADDMLDKLPADYVQHEIKERLTKMGLLQPLNIFLRQEIDRMQNVVTMVRNTLTDLKLAIDGTIIMSENLRDALDSMYDARIPKSWKRMSWESATIGFWFTDLLDRHAQFTSWLIDGRPNTFWMTGFFNPQGFLTAMRQEITRAHKGWALDAVFLENDVTKSMKEDISSPPAEGVYIHGLYLDGAGWDKRNSRLCEPAPKVLYPMMPVVHVYAVVSTDKRKSTNVYECPVYKKPRRTDLTYIFPLMLKSSRDPDHWIMRGVALLCDTK